jgi:hypothetical protein
MINEHELQLVNEMSISIYRRGYEDGVVETEKINDKAHNDGYNKGLHDAWDCARKIMLCEAKGGLSTDKYTEIFGNIATFQTLEILSASEAISAIKEYEEKHTDKQIKQWDEICGKDEPQNKLIVVGIGAWGDWHCVDNEGHAFKLGDEYKKCWKKTGKSYPELANILEQLKGDKE